LFFHQLLQSKGLNNKLSCCDEIADGKKEENQGKPVDKNSHVFILCCLLYGRRAFSARLPAVQRNEITISSPA